MILHSRVRARLSGASLCALLALAVLMGAPVQAQVINELSSLSFGAFVAGGTGSVVLDAQGPRRQTGEVYLTGQGAAASTAVFAVAGSPFTSYAITLPANGTVTLVDGRGNTMAVNAFASSIGGAGVLAGDGSAQFRVGATLLVGFGQAPGQYSGAFNITLEYQ
jgi:hypothetical protein